MITSRLEKRIYSYLNFRGAKKDENTDAEILRCIKELEGLAHFVYEYKFFDSPPAFLNKPPYFGYLKGSRGVIISVMTLGGEVDRRIKFYERTDAAKAVILDACASAYLEELSDEYERGIADNLSYRFCPGYGGSDVSDLKYIFEILKPEKRGITLTQTNYMLPCKTMAGIIAVGKSSKKSCENCIVFKGCEYRKEGKTCYGSESK